MCVRPRRGSSDNVAAPSQKDYGINGGTGHCCPERSQTSSVDGVAWLNSRTVLSTILDGTSNTFLLLEKRNDKDQSWLPDGYGSNHFIFVHHPSQGYVQGYTLPNTDAFNNRGPQSAHDGGVLAAFADGHVAFVTNSINGATYLALFTKANNDVVGNY